MEPRGTVAKDQLAHGTRKLRPNLVAPMGENGPNFYPVVV